MLAIEENYLAPIDVKKLKFKDINSKDSEFLFNVQNLLTDPSDLVYQSEALYKHTD